MHITHPASGVMVTPGIVGGSMPIANGLAWASQLKGDGRVTAAYFGDGAANIDAFHESLNLASVWKLPVVFVCQNNEWGEHTAYAKATSAPRVADRAQAYAMPGIRVDGNDVFETYAAAREAIDRARGGGGPPLIEAMTCRFHGHICGDADAYMDIGAAIDDPDPVVFIKNLSTYGDKGDPAEAGYRVPIGSADIVAEGRHVTIIAYARMVQEASAAVAKLAEENISAELIDLRSVAPWDRHTVLASVRKTGRVPIVHEAVTPFGVGADISAVLNEMLFGSLKAPVKRLGVFCAVPFSRPLEAAFAPRSADIEMAAKALLTEA